MATVKIKFSIEVDDENFAEHTIEYRSTYFMRHPLETDEEKLATDIINKMNQLETTKKLKSKNWDSLFGEHILKDGHPISTCGESIK
ncbi:hypothetical protein HYE59_07070 [Aggregatibacter actinomycetemcomitans]|uniref:hypothetical protein n=1 Tax=Aggregatibacter actinomycetemcomitans TaxID=714 RepID=UPI00197B88D9|nr:hypothetical protein [Aggregatibacter actinomycetemcomitans]MBN6077297.1 hypothetical protein [Aggregatibacter actinomycetemcomitans]